MKSSARQPVAAFKLMRKSSVVGNSPSAFLKNKIFGVKMLVSWAYFAGNEVFIWYLSLYFRFPSASIFINRFLSVSPITLSFKNSAKLFRILQASGSASSALKWGKGCLGSEEKVEQILLKFPPFLVVMTSLKARAFESLEQFCYKIEVNAHFEAKNAYFY